MIVLSCWFLHTVQLNCVISSWSFRHAVRNHHTQTLLPSWLTVELTVRKSIAENPWLTVELTVQNPHPWISVHFQIEWNIIVFGIFLLFWSQIKFQWPHNKIRIANTFIYYSIRHEKKQLLCVWIMNAQWEKCCAIHKQIVRVIVIIELIYFQGYFHKDREVYLSKYV